MRKILETPRLILRELHHDDASFIVDLVNTPSWLRFIGDRGVHNTVDAINYLDNGPINSYLKNGFGLWLIVLKVEDKPVGMCGLIQRIGLDDIDIGFALLPEYEGHGIGYEAAAATLQYGMQELNIPRIVAITDPENVASIHLIQKIGMKAEGTVRLPGEDLDLLLFGINAS
jgi:ribosomal-protein-alanine N-acetyltransferase